MRDFKEKEIFEQTKKNSNKEKSSLINASQVVLGEYTKTKPITTYQDLHNHPDERKSIHNYDKINYKLPKYKLHPLTSKPISIESHDFWSFDFYNPGKSKNHNSNDKPTIPNRNYNKIYDPITNRYLN